MKKIGRPKTDTQQMSLRLHADMIEALDDLRRQDPDLPSRPEIIRRIIAQHLEDLRNAKT